MTCTTKTPITFSLMLESNEKEFFSYLRTQEHSRGKVSRMRVVFYKEDPATNTWEELPCGSSYFKGLRKYNPFNFERVYVGQDAIGSVIESVMRVYLN